MMSPSLSLLLLLVAAAAFQLTEAAQAPYNRFTTPKAVGKGVPAKDLDNKSGFVRFGLGQSRRPLPPPSEGWLVIMQRFDFKLDFNRNWSAYQDGFGELGPQKEFWLGNEVIHVLTTGVPHKLRIEIQTAGALFYADYESFRIESEEKRYVLLISGYSGNAGDSLTNKTVDHNGVRFSTPDKDKTSTKCAVKNKAGWWFKDCDYGCLTCKQALWKSLPSTASITGVRMRVMRI
jgi:hypothetical protein